MKHILVLSIIVLLSLVYFNKNLECSALHTQSLIELEKQLKNVAGIYKDKLPMNINSNNGKQLINDLKNTVLITACNHGFINHLHNFKCFADRLGMKFLVIAMDKHAYHYITHNTTMNAFFMTGGVFGEVTGLSTEFRSKQFNLITAKKKEIVHDILKLGYNVLFSDTDVAMIRDPIPYMIRANVDYAHSLNYMCTVGNTWDFHRSKVEGNTGFYFVRSNNNTVKLWADAFAAAPRFPRLDDQAVFWKVIRSSIDPPILPIGKCRHFTTADDLSHLYQHSHQGHVHKKFLVSCMLDTCVFSSGMISNVYEPELTYDTLLSNLNTLKEDICTLHANYISGNAKKMNRMKEYGFWLAEEENGIYSNNKCKEYIQKPPTLFIKPSKN